MSATPRPPKKGVMIDPETPQRRSIYDLQLLIDEVFERVGSSNDDGTKTCRVADLPEVLVAFEARRKLVLLTDEEKLSLNSFAEQHPEVDVSSEQLVSLLAAMTAQNNAPGSPTPSFNNKQLPTPPPSDDEENRRRSASYSSTSSEGSHDSNMLSGRGSLDIPEGDSSFPRSISMPDYLGTSPPPELVLDKQHRRAHTSSDPEKAETSSQPGHATNKSIQHTPMSASMLARQRSSPLEIQAKEGFRRSRPAPPKHRRTSGDGFRFSAADNEGRRSRQSSEETPFDALSPQETMLSPSFGSLESMREDTEYGEQYAERPRQPSNRSFRGSSPLFGTAAEGLMASPMFPPTSPSLDPSSFHAMPMSPPEPAPFGHDRGLTDFSLDGLASLHSRPVSTASLQSEAAMAEMIQQLQQELARKTQDLDAQKADGYSAVMEKEALLEEARAELAAKRREEKELRGKEKVNLSQIATLEAQTATFRDERDKQRTAYQNARKQYEEQCNESEKLRNQFRAKDEELRVSDENMQNSNNDLAKVGRERDYLQGTVVRLEGELSEARAAVELLEEQKTENLQLRETIDRLRMDLDELRAQARVIEAKGSSSLSRSASGSESLPASLSRNLGRELARRLKEAEDDGDETETETGGNERHKKDSSDSYEEEIITTRRRLKRPVRKTTEAAATEQHGVEAPKMITLDVIDVGIQVTPPPIEKATREIQTEPEPEPSRDDKRDMLARELHVDLTAVEAYIRDKEERARLQAQVPDTAPPPYQGPPTGWQYRFQPYAPTIARYIPQDTQAAIELVLHSSSNFLLYSFLVFLSGVLSGGILVPVRHHHHVASYDSFANWAAYNTLDLQQGAHAGWRDSMLWWLEKLIWKGVAISRRVPT